MKMKMKKKSMLYTLLVAVLAITLIAGPMTPVLAYEGKSPTRPLVVRVAPTVPDNTQYIGDMATFTVDDSQCGVVTNYAWYRNGVPILSGATENVLEFVTIIGHDGATIICVVTNASGDLPSNTARVYVLTPPAFDFTTTGESVVPEGLGWAANAGSHMANPVTLSAVITTTDPDDTGPLGLTYQWTKDGGAVPGATNSTLELEPLSTGDQAITDGYDVTINGVAPQL